jgi:hypothetical protein
MAQIRAANRSMAAGITLCCAISAGQDGKRSCGCGNLLLAASDYRRMGCSTSQRFRPKLFTHAHSYRFPDTGCKLDSEPYSYRDSKGSDQNHSQPNADPKTMSHSNSNAVVPRPEYNANTHTHAFSCIPLAALG